MTGVGSAWSANDVVARELPTPQVNGQINRAQVAEGQGAAPLQILSVRWGATINTGNYSSVRLDAEAVVPMGGSAASTLKELQDWVASQSPLSEYQRDDMRRSWEAFHYDADMLARKKDELQHQVDAMQAFCEKHGFPVPWLSGEDLPF